MSATRDAALGGAFMSSYSAIERVIEPMLLFDISNSVLGTDIVLCATGTSDEASTDVLSGAGVGADEYR